MGKERKRNYEPVGAYLRHLAIIMDGNGRWAEKNHLSRIEGHRRGVKTVEMVVKECSENDIPFLTLYSFSTENWKRPISEVQALFELFNHSIRDYGPKLHANRVKVRFIGRRDGIPGELIREINTLEDMTALNDKLTLNLAINYGGRDEILRAFLKILHEKGAQAKTIRESDFQRYLDTHDHPDPDLLIRTAGEMRLSNFLLWQLAYSEMWFTRVLWPDFSPQDLHQAFNDFISRKRKFGGLKKP